VIPCTLRRHLRSYHKHDVLTTPRYGTYLQSLFHSIKGYGKKWWAIGVEIDLDYATVTEACSDEEIIKRCIEYLNTPPKSKYGKHRRRKPPFGTFRPQPYRFWVKEKNGQIYLQAILLAGKRKNNKFWGEGPHL
jgi:hypothetical protein